MGPSGSMGLDYNTKKKKNLSDNFEIGLKSFLFVFSMASTATGGTIRGESPSTVSGSIYEEFSPGKTSTNAE